MNSLGLSIILKMGCICSRENVYINNVKYLIKDHLGDGGFSTVDLIENVNNKRRYALKRIKCHSIEDQKIALKEIEYYKKIKHINIIELIDSDVKGSADIIVNATSEVFVLLPYYRRGTLHHILEMKSIRKEHWTSVEILNMFLGICEGLRALHEASPEPLAHRDLKTANICLDDDMTPVLMDFGSTTEARVKVCGSVKARELEDLASERCSMPYRAPELFNVESYCMIDERTDIWSLGCVLYAMCYFKSPFDAVHERGDSVPLAVISGNVNFPENSPYEQNLNELIMFMLKTNPMERPYIYSVIEQTHDLMTLLENKA